MSERKDTRVVAAVGVILHLDGAREPCMSRNISRGGVFVLSRRQLPVGTTLQVEIVRGSNKILAKARVSTQASDGLGLQFVDIDDNVRTAITDLIVTLLNEQSGESAAIPVDTDNKKQQIYWSNMAEGRGWNWFRKRRASADLLSLSVDGAALSTKKRPEVGEIILVFLTDEGGDEEDDARQCRAEVVRHTERGFAVKFLAPSMEFRRTVSRMRRVHLPS